MTDYTLTKEARRELTEKVLGKCWHTWVDKPGEHPDCVCSYCGCSAYGNGNERSFDNPADAHALVVAMIKNGWWNSFHEYADDIYLSPEAIGDCSHSGFTAWLLIDPERFCWLVYQSKCWEG